MTLQPADLDRLEQLAREASEQVESGNEWDRQHGDALGDLEAECDPATVLELVAAARLGAAWQEAEAALPEGWRLLRLAERPALSDAERWEAWAVGPDQPRNVYEYGPTPAAALLALAEALRGRGT